MAKKLKVGDTLRGYRVKKVFGPGMMAISYGAEAPDGGQVFLKQYKSPTPAVVWYPQFVDYQQELSKRIRHGKAAHYAIRLTEAFEETWGGGSHISRFTSSFPTGEALTTYWNQSTRFTGKRRWGQLGIRPCGPGT